MCFLGIAFTLISQWEIQSFLFSLFSYWFGVIFKDWSFFLFLFLLLFFFNTLQFWKPYYKRNCYNVDHILLWNSIILRHSMCAWSRTLASLNIEFLGSSVGRLWSFWILMKLINRRPIFILKNITPEWVEILVLTGYCVSSQYENVLGQVRIRQLLEDAGVNMSNQMILKNFVKFWTLVIFFTKWTWFYRTPSLQSLFQNPCRPQSVSGWGEFSGKGFLYQQLFAAPTSFQREKGWIHSCRMFTDVCSSWLWGLPTLKYTHFTSRRHIINHYNSVDFTFAVQV